MIILHVLLDPVCAAWEALPSTRSDNGPSLENSLAANHIRWAFIEKPPTNAIRYFIEKARSSELRWPISYMLLSVDNPDAVEFIAAEAALTDERLEGKGSFNTLSMHSRDEWRRRRRSMAALCPMGPEYAYLIFWKETGACQHLRRQAFILWAATTTDGD